MWNKLSMADRVKYIRLGAQSGITDLSTIKKVYNAYAGGGELPSKGDTGPIVPEPPFSCSPIYYPSSSCSS